MKTPAGKEVRFVKLTSVYPHRWRLECCGVSIFLEKHKDGKTVIEKPDGEGLICESYDSARDVAFQLFDGALADQIII